MDPIDLKLTNITLAELMQELEEIPSDPESDTKSNDDDNEPTNQNQLVLSDVTEDSDDDNIPLEQVRVNLLEQISNQNTNISPPVWNKTNILLPVPQFTENGELTDLVSEITNCTPYKLFSLLVTDDLLDHILFETNLYAHQKFLETNKRYTPATKCEIKTFLGINILMGIKRLPSYRDYWSADEDLNDPYISKLMTVNRFGWFLSHLHLNNNQLMPPRGTPNYDKLYKIRPFLTAILQNFQKCMKLHEHVAIDESMIKFKDRSSLKQYMPKPIKRGYKIWALADSTGYLYNFEIYTGKVNNIVTQNLGESVVLRLSKCLEGKNHRLYFDNYFNSYPLQKKLQDSHIYACDTVNAGRKFLPTLTSDKSLKRGESDWRISDSGVSIVKWRDKRCVHLLTNFQDPSKTITVTRKEKNGERSQVECPEIVRDYNNHMNYVDKFDQNKKTYEIDRKSKKWWTRIFWYFIDAAVVNAFILYEQRDEVRPIDLKKFRRLIVDGLVSETLVERKKRKFEDISHPTKICRVPIEVRQESSAHQPKRVSRRRCAYCSSKTKQVRSEWGCSVCKLALCLSKNKLCFQKYHCNN